MTGKRRLTQTKANLTEEAAAAPGSHIVELPAREEIPVMGHLGVVPRKSACKGGLRGIGKTAAEAVEL